jgi:hypothetical protein
MANYLIQDKTLRRIHPVGVTRKNASGARKPKWTVTIAAEIDEQVESYLKKNKKLNLNRSAIVQEAVEIWLAKQSEEEEEAYYKAHAAELNADSESWTRITNEAANYIWLPSARDEKPNDTTDGSKKR